MSDSIDTAKERKWLDALEGHTPGPWRNQAAKGMSADIGILADGGCLAECFHEIRKPNEGAYHEQAANSNLIAAAPALKDTLAAALDEIDRLTAERDEARAQVAMAYEVAAQDVEEWREEDGKASYNVIAGAIRALTPADAEAALQRMVDATWNEAVGVAAVTFRPHARVSGMEVEKAILALKRSEASHE